MLTLNIQQICAQRHINQPFTYLRSLGFTNSTAHQLLNQKNSGIKLQHLELLCSALRCTPNDLIIYSPDKGKKLPDNHPLLELQARVTPDNLTNAIQNLSLEKLKELNQFVAQLNNPKT